jgi:hypothetical protein
MMDNISRVQREVLIILQVLIISIVFIGDIVLDYSIRTSRPSFLQLIFKMFISLYFRYKQHMILEVILSSLIARAFVLICCKVGHHIITMEENEAIFEAIIWHFIY